MRTYAREWPGGTLARALFWAVALSSLAAGLAAASAASRPAGVVAAAELPPDYAVPAGRFYTQTAAQGGFGVRDLAGVAFWTEYQRHGGPAALGYPISRPFWGPGGFLYQAFERGLLQWRPELGQAYLANTMEMIEAHESGHDQWLFDLYSIPSPRRPKQGGFDEEASERLNWLSNEPIKDAFFTNPATGGPWELEAAANHFGLPQSEPQPFGPFIVQRFQRVPLQLWVQQVAGMPPPGSVAWVLSGELAKACGVVPRDSTVPEPLVPFLPQLQLADERPALPSPTFEAESYRVASGDSLSAIAARVYGQAARWQELYEANRDQMGSPHRLEPGMLLRLPR